MKNEPYNNGNNKIKGYVINLSRCPERLEQFNNNPYAHYFERVSAIDKFTLEKIGLKNLFFNINLFEKNTRLITTGEIACTLSHILCWEKISKNDNLSYNDYAIIAEDDIILLDEFDKKINNILNYINNFDIYCEIVLLHRLDLWKQDKELTDNQNLLFRNNFSLNNNEDIIYVNDNGAALYLIRKDVAERNLTFFKQNKPHWLADHFTAFTYMNCIAVVYPYLGKIIDTGDSDLEPARRKVLDSIEQIGN